MNAYLQFKTFLQNKIVKYKLIEVCLDTFLFFSKLKLRRTTYAPNMSIALSLKSIYLCVLVIGL